MKLASITSNLKAYRSTDEATTLKKADRTAVCLNTPGILLYSSRRTVCYPWLRKQQHWT